MSVDTQFKILENIITPLCSMPYQNQLLQKQAWAYKISKELRAKLHNAKSPIVLPKVYSISPSPQIDKYRNKDEYNFRPGIDGNPKTLGFFVGSPAKENIYCVSPKNLINMKESHLNIAQNFQEYVRQSALPVSYDHLDGGFWRGIVVRSNLEGDIMCIVVANPRGYSNQVMLDEQHKLVSHFKKKSFDIKSLYYHPSLHTRSSKDSTFILIDGEKYIYENICGYKFRISPDSFFQINTLGAEVLYDELFKLLKPSKVSTLLDLCSGTGTVSIIGNKYVQSCLGIEVVSQAIDDAKENARINGVTNCDFINGKIETVMSNVLKELTMTSDLCTVLNPGRAGVHPRVITAIRKNKLINNIVYVSCKANSPATMKNLVELALKNKKTTPFTLESIKPIDMFPHTNHCELMFFYRR
ncbi:tRNA (uracil-5-)-methyltransferase homolog B-like isoform X2 [Daktulosphaira vitifoliae]|nr:tRNA (uracil-5-)-methyltransferase homolog B-like isoform X2 [Daktulosphaira vitifoliae]